MNIDIRLSVGFWEHPKTVKLINRLGLEGPVALQKLWLWASQNRPDGVLSDMDVEDIEIAAKWNGEPTALYGALTALKFVDTVEGTNVLHNWKERNSWQSESGLRSGKSRLSRLARACPDAHKALIEGGRQAITEEEYTLIRSSNDRTTVVQRILYDRSSPFLCLSFPEPNPEPKPRKKEEGVAEDVAAAPPVTPAPAFTLPLADGTDFPVTRDLFTTWESAYPLVDIRGELKRVKAWLLSNPAKRPAKNMPRFVNTWMAKEQDEQAKHEARRTRASPSPKSTWAEQKQATTKQEYPSEICPM